MGCMADYQNVDYRICGEIINYIWIIAYKVLEILSDFIKETLCCINLMELSENGFGIFSCCSMNFVCPKDLYTNLWFVLEWKHVLVGGFHVNLHHSSEENVFKRHITYKHPSRHLFVEKIHSAVRVPYYCQFNYRVSS